MSLVAAGVSPSSRSTTARTCAVGHQGDERRGDGAVDRHAAGRARGPPTSTSSTMAPSSSARRSTRGHGSAVFGCIHRPREAGAERLLESFNGRFRDECLNESWFITVGVHGSRSTRGGRTTRRSGPTARSAIARRTSSSISLRTGHPSPRSHRRWTNIGGAGHVASRWYARRGHRSFSLSGEG